MASGPARSPTDRAASETVIRRRRRFRSLEDLDLPIPLEASPPAGPAPDRVEHPLEVPPPRFFLSRTGRWVVGVLAIVLVAGLVGGRPAYRALKTWRAHKFVAEAERLIQATNWAAAFQKAQVAYQLSPYDPRTLRLAARLTAAQGQREAMVFWQQLIETGHATAEDRRDLGQYALRGRDLTTAAEQLQWLLKNEPDTFATLKFATDFYYLQGDAARTKEFGRRALAKQPADEGLRLFLARVLANSPEVAEQIEARRTIRTVAEGGNAAALAALELLAGLRDLPRDEAEQAAERLIAHPLAKTDDYLLALDLRLRWHPEQREAIVSEAVTKFEKTGAENLLYLCRWLNQWKEFQRTLDCLSPETALKAQDLLLVRLDALAGLGRWREVEEVLNIKDVALEPALVDLFKARVAKELGRPLDAEQGWRRVHLAAIDRPVAWLYIARYAEQIGDFAEAAKAWHRLKQDPNLGRLAFQALIRLGELDGNTRALRELMKEMTKAFPTEVEPRNDLAYLELLLNENLNAAKETGLQLVKEHPNFLAYRTTLALAHLRLREPDEAERLYRGVNLDWAAVLPGWQAVRVAMLGANGKTNLARVAAQRIPLSQLKPEERALIEPFL
jgi:tetratricopeptide (TPR) repeat protein